MPNPILDLIEGKVRPIDDDFIENLDFKYVPGIDHAARGAVGRNIALHFCAGCDEKEEDEPRADRSALFQSHTMEFWGWVRKRRKTLPVGTVDRFNSGEP